VALFQGLKDSWRRLKQGKPGHRFQAQYQAHQSSRRSRWSKPVAFGLGALILAVGIVALPAPGPGTIVLAIGAALIARESEWTARSLDWLEVRARSILARIKRRLSASESGSSA
jgi:uncharacterized protein (TIGR02611 family)